MRILGTLVLVVPECERGEVQQSLADRDVHRLGGIALQVLELGQFQLGVGGQRRGRCENGQAGSGQGDEAGAQGHSGSPWVAGRRSLQGYTVAHGSEGAGPWAPARTQASWRASRSCRWRFTSRHSAARMLYITLSRTVPSRRA